MKALLTQFGRARTAVMIIFVSLITTCCGAGAEVAMAAPASPKANLTTSKSVIYPEHWIRIGLLPESARSAKPSLLGPIFKYIDDPIHRDPIPAHDIGLASR
jgi:hypothetical protein